MRPEELKAQGLAHFQADRLPQAADSFRQAAQAYQERGDQLAAAEMRNNAGVAHLGHEQWTEALAAVEGTPEVFRAGGDRLRQAQALANQAAALEGLGRAPEASQ